MPWGGSRSVLRYPLHETVHANGSSCTATNSFHEAHLFAAFRLPSSDKIKKQTQAKQLFRLNNVMLMYGEETTDYRSLLDLAKVRSRSGLELVGLAL